ncbi:hypothetical protein GE21DRAFT_9957 [Neurospora crassa]|uniref:Uncharacterized protein n=1 Tax=Neurospora crassa (strain ATCC 24698 / 74-OR23-1A / CBS 708.71 / DSM 1257 / FGSC 987) TaxID=367110 RepID=A7UXD0_NEUCR|nr:hypothetical protein NCU10896 [Neurospora crassa OR74A]EDO64911.1 hypothetical protein NCU10896 [Neurospora crassa OR74A]KHE85683.1 hypothetical protein GE21DRAFT_9957 [Neurospora crassa]|eukprot:XP_001728002.1 hypothetical protein NCU10896 [Neurospora crassa OR74A]
MAMAAVMDVDVDVDVVVVKVRTNLTLPWMRRMEVHVLEDDAVQRQAKVLQLPQVERKCPSTIAHIVPTAPFNDQHLTQETALCFATSSCSYRIAESGTIPKLSVSFWIFHFVLRAVDGIESWSMAQYYPHPVRVLNTVKALALFTGLSLPYVCVSMVTCINASTVLSALIDGFRKPESSSRALHMAWRWFPTPRPFGAEWLLYMFNRLHATNSPLTHKSRLPRRLQAPRIATAAYVQIQTSFGSRIRCIDPKQPGLKVGMHKFDPHGTFESAPRFPHNDDIFHMMSVDPHRFIFSRLWVQSYFRHMSIQTTIQLACTFMSWNFLGFHLAKSRPPSWSLMRPYKTPQFHRAYSLPWVLPSGRLTEL